MLGRIHSLETFGTVDGPGIRFVLFMQGCAMKCLYCHNPDTWEMKGGKVVSVEDVLAEIEPYLGYYRRSGGGITVTGGEATLQAHFVEELFRECKRRWNLHTTLDTNGFCEPDHVAGLMEVTDLVLLDLKHIDREKHIALTSQPNDRMLKFAKYLSDTGKNMWIRHVLVPGYTDDEEDLYQLGRFIGSLNGVEKLELLPYHTMGVFKWEELGWDYQLKDISSPNEDEVARANRILNEGIAAEKASKVEEKASH
ncbi:pyruvate formate-lyase-activating protein [Gorillibacterium massiliense]|uniref:pyruvate formate-lyase-activating protein n=1 Tax=Gorillibacterium massiliense TaxID=1280390 RepID=UPI0004B3ED6B|nr:pyruvate formate-lyase-activating protein [Gorillibacterium massiliense]